MALLRKGLRGEPVRRLQARLGVDADGIFGPGTEKALRDYQQSNGLSVDGIAGPDTFSHMGLHELVLLRRGSRGKTVKKLQEALGVGADGIFGGGTEKAVKAFQEKHGLSADGMAGPATLAKMDLFADIDEQTVARARVPENYVDPVPPANLEADEATIRASKEADEEGGMLSGIWGTVKGWFS